MRQRPASKTFAENRKRPVSRFFVSIRIAKTQGDLRVNVWRNGADLIRRWNQCRDIGRRHYSERNPLLRAFYVARRGLPRSSARGVLGEFNFTVRSIACSDTVAHECVHCALDLLPMIDLNNLDEWEERVAFLTGNLAKSLQYESSDSL